MRAASAASPAPRTSFAANAALLAVTIVITIAALEGIARLIFPAPLPWKYPQLRYRPDPTLVFAWQPNQRGFSADKEIVINERGLRGPVVPYERTPGTKRILFLGDSITFGYGVRDEEVVTERVRALLGAAGVRAETINTAIASYNTEQEVAYYEHEGNRYDPDVVVVGVCWNDINDKSNVRVDAHGNLVDVDAVDRPTTKSDAALVTDSELRNTLKRSRLLYGTLERWRAYQASRTPDDHVTLRDDVLSGHTTERVEAGWSRMEDAFGRLQTSVTSHGARLLIVAFPVPLMLEHAFPSSSYPARLRDFTAREHIPFLDLTGAFQAAFHGHESLFIPFDGDHPNAEGHDLAAHEIVRMMGAWVG
jgi:lysophospholipase L1-like esterase